MIPIRWSIEHPDLIVGVVQADGLSPRVEGDPLAEEIAAAIAAARDAERWPPEPVRKGIRNLLRRGGFKPSGRSKPASEYLAKTAIAGAFPRISAAVDVNNLQSLRTGWPMSVIDQELALGDGVGLELRFGREDESYIFNTAGQAIRLKGLICVARDGGECIANPVKDAQAVKTHEDTTRGIAFLYASRALTTMDEVRAEAERYGELLRRAARASTIEVAVLP